MATITKAEILAVVNKRLNRSETDIDEEIRSILYDISSRADFLKKEGTRNTVKSRAYYSVPDDFKDKLVIKIDDSEPLDRITFAEYQQKIADDTSESEPTDFALHDDFIWLYPTPDAVYEMTLFYAIYHPNNVANILFGEQFRECIYKGVLMEVCNGYELYDAGDKWEIKYEREILKREMNLKKDPAIVKYRDF